MSLKNMQQILDALPPEKYLSVVGEKTDNPLHTFKSKYIPGAMVSMGGGKPIMPPQRANGVWQEKMSQQAEKSSTRTAYIHIPFCSKICLYCGFFQNHTNEEAENIYVDHLIKEMSMDVDKPYMNTGLIHSVFFGGGTPSALSPENIAKVLKALKEYLPLANDCEITMEARINDLIKEKMDVWFSHGVNRISIGVQSFDTELRQRMGRIDTKETVIERLKAISAYNQASIIIDIIYGLPGQTEESFMQDLAIIDSLPINGMDLYQLSLLPNTPMVKAIEAGKMPPAASRWQQAEMFAKAVEWLDDRAYFRLSNCHWSKNNRERSMYNLFAKSGAEMFPYGSGAGGNISGVSVMLHRDMARYLESVTNGEKPIMFASLEASAKSLQKEISHQLELGFLNIDILAEKYGEKLNGLKVLLDLWVERGLFSKGSVLYKVEIAGQYWIKNIVPITSEYARALLNE